MKARIIAPQAIALTATLLLNFAIQPNVRAANDEALPPAKDSPQLLQPLQPSLDDTAVPKRLLNGQVSKQDTKEESKPSESTEQVEPRIQIFMNNSSGAPVQLNGAQMQRLQNMFKTFTKNGSVNIILGDQKVLTDPSPFFGAAQKTKMSPEEFRKMEYGVVGMESIVRPDGNGPTVLKVVPGCPAALAGIQPGDQVVKANGHVFQAGEGQRSFWKTFCGKAGTPVDVTVLREGNLLEFHMTRMNIEDIPDEPLRRTYEAFLSLFGPGGHVPGGDE